MCWGKQLKDYKHKSLHLAQKYAQIQLFRQRLTHKIGFAWLRFKVIQQQGTRKKEYLCLCCFLLTCWNNLRFNQATVKTNIANNFRHCCVSFSLLVRQPFSKQLYLPFCILGHYLFLKAHSLPQLHSLRTVCSSKEVMSLSTRQAYFRSEWRLLFLQVIWTSAEDIKRQMPLGLSLSLETPQCSLILHTVRNVLLCGWILLTTSNFSRNIKGKSRILSRNRFYAL